MSYECLVVAATMLAFAAVALVLHLFGRIHELERRTRVLCKYLDRVATEPGPHARPPREEWMP